MLEPELFSKTYTVRRITADDIPQVVEVCKENTEFYKHCPPFVTEETVKKDMEALPDRKTMEDKYYVGFYEHEDLIAVVDLIDAFPDKETAFIGFFMTAVPTQGKGIGTQIVLELRQYLKSRGYKHIRLGWVKGNPQSEGFWHKNGFVETGVTYDTCGYTVIVAQRDL